MSDLFQARQKVEEGAQWRGTVNVVIDDEQHDLTVRQLFDTEFWEVMSLVDNDEIKELQDRLPAEKMEELNELREKDDLSDEEADRMEAIQTEIEEEDIDMFSILSLDTFRGVQKAGKYGTEPDQRDIQRVLTQHGGEVKEKYGTADEESARKWANDNVINPLIDRSTNFTSFAIGIRVITESIGDTGNSEP